VKLMQAEYVRPFVKSNKNDYVDAEAIAEAVQRPTMRFVPTKNEAQLDLQALHRVGTAGLTERLPSSINSAASFWSTVFPSGWARNISGGRSLPSSRMQTTCPHRG
jgi:hypothetical protein